MNDGGWWWWNVWREGSGKVDEGVEAKEGKKLLLLYILCQSSLELSSRLGFDSI